MYVCGYLYIPTCPYKCMDMYSFSLLLLDNNVWSVLFVHLYFLSLLGVLGVHHVDVHFSLSEGRINDAENKVMH